MTKDTTMNVKLSGGDWLKIIGVVVFYSAITLMWAVKMESRVASLEAEQSKLSAVKDIVTRIDERTIEFSKRFERIEQTLNK